MNNFKLFEQVSYDDSADAMYFKVSNKKIENTKSVNNYVFVDYDSDGGIVGVEILHPSQEKEVVNDFLFSKNSVVSCVSSLQTMQSKESKKEVLR